MIEEVKYVECQKCRSIHYVVDEKRAEALKKAGNSLFPGRNLAHCRHCGQSGPFGKVPSKFVNEHSPNIVIYPILLDKDKPKEKDSKEE